jgi:hypothetical protein
MDYEAHFNPDGRARRGGGNVDKNARTSVCSLVTAEKLDGERVYRIVSPEPRKGKAGRTAA